MNAFSYPENDFTASLTGALPLRWQEHMQERAR
jgi:hypothetical protein